MASQVTAAVDAVRAHLAERAEVVAVYLFGSTARRELEPQDLDLAVMFAPGIDGFRATLALHVELERLVHRAVDVHDFDALPVDLRFRVLSEGTAIVDRGPKERVHREVAAMFAYYDFRPYLDRVRSAARQRLAAGARHG